MKYACILALIAPVMAHAQDDPVTPALCDRLIEHVQTVMPYSVEIGGRAVEAQSCVLTDVIVEFPTIRAPDVRIGRLALAGSGFEAFLSDMTPLRAVTLDIDNLQILPNVGDPAYDYLIEVQQARNLNDIDISVRWDGVQNAVILDRFEIDFPFDNAILATMRIENADLRSLSALETSLGGMAVTEFTLAITSNGLFESYGASMVIPTLLGGEEDPRARVAELKAQAQAMIPLLPQSIFRGESRDALSALVEDMPTPGGTLSLALSANPGLSALRFGPVWLGTRFEGPEDVWPFLEGVVIDVTYDRVPIE